MKLLLCTHCGDVQKLLVMHWRKCACEQSAGRYLNNGDDVEIQGAHCLVMGINNESLAMATRRRNYKIVNPIFTTNEFRAWVFADDYKKIRRATAAPSASPE